MTYKGDYALIAATHYSQIFSCCGPMRDLFMGVASLAFDFFECLLLLQVKLVKCVVADVVVDVSFETLGGLCTVAFLESIDRKIGRGHLFKRSIVLVRASRVVPMRVLLSMWWLRGPGCRERSGPGCWRAASDAWPGRHGCHMAVPAILGAAERECTLSKCMPDIDMLAELPGCWCTVCAALCRSRLGATMRVGCWGRTTV